MHQLLLIGTIPHSQYVQTVSTLQAFTGQLHPQPITTYTLVCKPNQVFKPKFEPGKVNQIEQYYMRCITTWLCDYDISKPALKGDDIFSGLLFDANAPEKNWTLQISDIPVAGKNQSVCAQTVYETTIVHTHTNVREEEPEMKVGVSPVAEEDAIKQETPAAEDKPEVKKDPEPIVVENDDVVDLTGEQMAVDPPAAPPRRDPHSPDRKGLIDILPLASSDRKGLVVATPKNELFLQMLSDLGYGVWNQYWCQGVRFFHGDIVIELFKLFVRDDDYQGDKIKLKLLDELNTFQVKVYVNVNKATNVDMINQGTKDLVKLQEYLKNLVKLTIPDRMFMDLRIQRT